MEHTKTNILRGICVLCLVFAFFWIGDIVWRTAGAEASILLVAFGLLYFGRTIDQRHNLKMYVRIFMVFWSILIFVVFVRAAQQAHPDYHGIPVWMQLATPYVYACGPLIIVWGIRMVIPTLWDIQDLKNEGE